MVVIPISGLFGGKGNMPSNGVIAKTSIVKTSIVKPADTVTPSNTAAPLKAPTPTAPAKFNTSTPSGIFAIVVILVITVGVIWLVVWGIKKLFFGKSKSSGGGKASNSSPSAKKASDGRKFVIWNGKKVYHGTGEWMNYIRSKK